MRNNRSAFMALLAAGGLYAWQNRDKIQGWLNNQMNQLNSQSGSGNLLSSGQSATGTSYGTGSDISSGTSYGTGSDISSGTSYGTGSDISSNLPATGETRRIGESDLNAGGPRVYNSES